MSRSQYYEKWSSRRCLRSFFLQMWRRYVEWKSAYWQPFFTYRLYFYPNLWHDRLPCKEIISPFMSFLLLVTFVPFLNVPGFPADIQSHIRCSFSFSLTYLTPPCRFIPFYAQEFSFFLVSTVSVFEIRIPIWDLVLCCLLTARSHITQSSIKPPFLNDRLKWYTTNPRRYVIGGPRPVTSVETGFPSKRNAKMGKVILEAYFMEEKNNVCNYDIFTKGIWNLKRKWQFMEEVLPLEL
jgi:hypothetical protein